MSDMKKKKKRKKKIQPNHLFVCGASPPVFTPAPWQRGTGGSSQRWGPEL